MMQKTCNRCGEAVPGWSGVHQSDGKSGSPGFVCGPCWSRVISEVSGREIEHIAVEPITLADFAGRKHTFYFRFRPDPRMLEAFELVDGVPGGYRFVMFDDPEAEERTRLVEPLIEKIRAGLQRQHLTPCRFTPGGLQIQGRDVRGWIVWDPDQDGRVPLLVIDGREVTWDHFGRMLMAFEGSQFRLDLVDRTAEP